MKWDPGKLQLTPHEVSAAKAGIRKRRRTSSVAGRFIAGPIDVDWLAQARKLGVTALWVGLCLWHIKGLRRADSFIVSNLFMQGLEVRPDAKGRALRALEMAGLITIESRGKRSPRVTIVVQRDSGARMNGSIG